MASRCRRAYTVAGERARAVRRIGVFVGRERGAGGERERASACSWKDRDACVQAVDKRGPRREVTIMQRVNYRVFDVARKPRTERGRERITSLVSQKLP